MSDESLVPEEIMHWFCFGFIEGKTRVSAYIGQPRRLVNMNDIKNAKKFAEVSENAVMTSCFYLGSGTKEEFDNVQED